MLGSNNIALCRDAGMAYAAAMRPESDRPNDRAAVPVRRTLCAGTLLVAAVLTLAPTASAQGSLNCDDFDSQAEAQDELRANPDDPDNLDDDNDGIACETLSPPRDEDPVSSPGGPPGAPPKSSPPKSTPPKGQPKEPPKQQPKEQPEQNKELLKAGGDLPLPQEPSTTADAGGGFPLWRVTGMILSAGVFVFAVYRLVSNR